MAQYVIVPVVTLLITFLSVVLSSPFSAFMENPSLMPHMFPDSGTQQRPASVSSERGLQSSLAYLADPNTRAVDSLLLAAGAMGNEDVSVEKKLQHFYTPCKIWKRSGTGWRCSRSYNHNPYRYLRGHYPIMHILGGALGKRLAQTASNALAAADL